VGGNFAFRPDKTYFRYALKLINKTGGQPVELNSLAFADSVVDCLYDNIYFRGGGSTVSSIVNFSPEAGVLKRRMNDSGAWLKSIGKDAYGMDSKFESRVNDLASNGTDLSIPQTTSIVAIDSAVTLTLVAATGVITATGPTTWTADNVGDTIRILNVDYPIIAYGSNLEITVDQHPAGDINATPANVVSITTKSEAARRNDKYVCWRPPIGIMDAGALFAGDYRFQLNPSARYAKRAIESLTDLNADDYTLTVEDIQLFVCIERMNAPATGVRKLYLDEYQIQSKTLAGGANDHNLDFSVPPSTKNIVVFVQSSAAGANNIVPITQFKCLDGSDEDLRSIQCTYGNVSKPATRYTSTYANNQNYMAQRYLDSQIATDMVNSEGGCETLKTWLTERGAYYAFSFERSASDRSTHLQLAIQYGALEANANVFVASIYSRVAEITTTNGFISSVQTLSV